MARATEAVGIDVGGLRLKAVRVRRDAVGGLTTVARAAHTVTDEDRTPGGLAARLAELAGDLGASSAAGVGIGVAGAVRQADGIIVMAANYPRLEGVDLVTPVAARLGLPVVIDNDANVFALAETRAGAGRGFSSLLGITLGTGVGGGVVLDGRVHRGARGLAGEVGHVVLHPGGERCGCGASGCIEQYASTLFLAREAARLGLAATQGVEPAGVGRALADAARAGEVEAAALFDALGRNLGCAMSGVVNVLDVEAVIVGGGLAAAFDLFGGLFETVLRERSFAGETLEIRRAELADEAGAIGAACLVLS